VALGSWRPLESPPVVRVHHPIVQQLKPVIQVVGVQQLVGDLKLD
jgi:hypothetical protein